MTEGTQVKRTTVNAVVSITVTVLWIVAMILVVFSGDCIGMIFGS